MANEPDEDDRPQIACRVPLQSANNVDVTEGGFLTGAGQEDCNNNGLARAYLLVGWVGWVKKESILFSPWASVRQGGTSKPIIKSDSLDPQFPDEEAVQQDAAYRSLCYDWALRLGDHYELHKTRSFTKLVHL
ncbi:hypothetical protein RJZ57_000140 [Blastomyces gilchristii]